MSVLQTKPENNNLTLSLLQVSKQCIDMLTQHNRFYIPFRRYHVAVRYEITQIGIVFLTDRGFQGSWLTCDLHDLHDLILGHAKRLGKLCHRRLIAQFQRQLTLHLGHLVDRLYHMHRDTDSSRLIRQSPCNRLTNPPGRICT